MGVLWQWVISGGVHGGVQRGVFSQGGDPVCGFFYVRYAVSYRDLEEIMAERGVAVEHATLNRWVVRYAPQIVCKARSSKRSVCRSWRMDETCVKVRGQWVYLYRSVAKHGEAVDLMLSTRRDSAAAKRFFRQAITSNGVPEKGVIDKGGSNLAGLQWQDTRLGFTRPGQQIKIRQRKYLNNIVEQDHRAIKRLTRPIQSFGTFHSADATLQGVEVAHMIRKGQFSQNGMTGFQQFANLAA